MIYRERSRKWVLLSAFLVCLVTGGLAQGLAGGGQEEEPRNPFADDPGAPDQGRTNFRIWCAFCHGLDARGGGRGPNLTLGRWEHGGSDAALFRTIRRGVRGTEMPPYLHGEDKIWTVISFLRTLGAPMTIYAHFDGKISILQHLWAVVLEAVFTDIRQNIKTGLDVDLACV